MQEEIAQFVCLVAAGVLVFYGLPADGFAMTGFATATILLGIRAHRRREDLTQRPEEV